MHPLHPCGDQERRLGKSAGLASSKKLCAHRNKIYQFKYITAIYNNQHLCSYFQSGGNSNETMHQWMEQSFAWLMRQTVGLERIPAISEIQKFAYNFMKAGKLIESTEDDLSKHGKTYYSEQLNDELFLLFSESVQCDPLREEHLDNNYGCGLLYFNDAERKIKKLNHYFSWLHCIKSTSYLKSTDYEKLIELIQEYEEKYGEKLPKHYTEFDIFNDKSRYSIINNDYVNEIRMNNDDDDDDNQQMDCDDNDNDNEETIDLRKLAKDMVNDIMNNDNTYSYWMNKLESRISKEKISEMVHDYWIGCIPDDSDEGSSSEEGDILLNGNDRIHEQEEKNEEEEEEQEEHKEEEKDNNEYHDCEVFHDTEQGGTISDTDVDEEEKVHRKRHIHNSQFSKKKEKISLIIQKTKNIYIYIYTQISYTNTIS